jgi:hypothetical protein
MTQGPKKSRVRRELFDIKTLKGNLTSAEVQTDNYSIA